jgi:hypothetical protein
MASFLSSLRNVRKRGMAKQDPSGISSQPASESLLPSAADSTSKVDLAATTPDNALNQQGSTPSHHFAAKAKALNMFKLTLATLGAARDSIPAPGLKLAIEGLLSAIERVQVCDEYLTRVCF